MARNPQENLSRRERQIMQAVYRRGEATVADIVGGIPEPPTADAIRRLCHILEDKGHLTSRKEGQQRVYAPTVAAGRARRRALDNLIDTFFGGSAGSLAAALLDSRGDQLDDDEIARLARLVDQAEQDGRS